MVKRESNRMFGLLFMLCAVCAVAAAWTIREKFIAHPLLALCVSAAVAAGLGLLFSRYLEFRLNTSVDALVDKVRKVAQGDLTVRFKEDPEDALPYGLSLEMGRLMAFLRENVGGLWKVSAQLSRQLNQLTAAVQELNREFETQAGVLARAGKNLEDVRLEITGLSKKMSDLKVNASNDSAFLKQVDSLMAGAINELKSHREVVKTVITDLKDVDSLAQDMKGVVSDFMEVSSKVGVIEKSVTELATEAGLLKLNASIDSVQAQGGDNYKSLLEELRRVSEGLTAVKQAGAETAGIAETRIQDLGKRLRSGEERLRRGLFDTEKTETFFTRVSGHYLEVAASYGNIFENVKRLDALMADVDERTLAFSGSIKSAAEGFDKLRADSQITLLRFKQLNERTAAIHDSLKTLDSFKSLFQIA